MSFALLSVLCRRSFTPLSTTAASNAYFTRAKPKKAAAGSAAAGKKKKVRKQDIETPDPVLHEMYNKLLAKVSKEGLPQYFVDAMDKILAEKPAEDLTPLDGKRYFKFQNRIKIRKNNLLQSTGVF